MLNRVLSRIKGPVVEKTRDPLYKDAKQSLEKLTFNFNQMINYINQVETTLQKLSDISLKFGQDIREFYSDAPQDQQLKAQTNLNFTKHFCALTNNFFIPRTNTNVISLLNQFNELITQANQLKEKLKLSRKEYDKSKALVQFLSEDSDTNTTKMREAIDKMDADNEKYSKLNNDFINLVAAINESREKEFERPFKNLVCLSSQYLMQVFSQVQKFRTTFPPNVFKNRENMNKKPNS